MYASLCDFVNIALLLPFVLGFCLSVFCFFCFFVSIVFIACYHWWICFLLWLLFFLSFLFFSFFYYFKNFLFLIIFLIFYFNNFIYFHFCFLPFILSYVADRVLVLPPGVRPVPLRHESQVQDTGPPETSRLHIISNGESSPEISISMLRPSYTQRPASYSAGHLMPNN